MGIKKDQIIAWRDYEDNYHISRVITVLKNYNKIVWVALDDNGKHIKAIHRYQVVARIHRIKGAKDEL